MSIHKENWEVVVMTKRTLVVAAAMLLAAAGTGQGQAPQGSVGIFFTATPTTGADIVRNGVIPFAPFGDIFVVSFDVPGGMEGYEFSVEVPRGMVVAGGRSLPHGGTNTGVGDDNWIVQTGGVCQGKVGTYALVRYAMPIFLAPPGNDVPICLWASMPSRVPGGGPGYLSCNSRGEMRSFEPAYKGCAIINRTYWWPVAPVGQVSVSFGALKAQY